MNHRARKSNPIEIVDSNCQHADDSDDEKCLEVGVSALQLNNKEDVTYVGSLPSRPRGVRSRRQLGRSLSSSLPDGAPGAPLLTSMKNDQSQESSLPPMQLTGREESHLASSATYGSLRESHLAGRFLDGPQSYRDKSSGQIHLLQHRAKDTRLLSPLQSGAPGLLLPPQNQMTPGERIASSNQSTPTHIPTTSTLSSMMEGAAPLPPSQQQQQQQQQRQTSNQQLSIQQQPLSDESEMLSTSLTGLELLQAAREHPELLQTMKAAESNIPMPGAPPPEPPALLVTSFDNDEQEDDKEENFFELDME